VQARFDDLGGYALEAKAREILAGLGFSQESMDGRRRAACRAAGRCASPSPASVDAPGRDAAGRAVQPPGPGIADLAGELSERVRGRAADDLARSRVPEPDRRARHRDRRRRAHQLLRQPGVLRTAARAERGAGAGRLRAPAGDAGEGDALHRTLQGPGGQGRPGPIRASRSWTRSRSWSRPSGARRWISSSRSPRGQARTSRASKRCTRPTARASSTTA
jgi:hypothetical protein